MMVQQQHFFLRDVAKLIFYATETGLLVTGGELYRTQEQQDIYVAKGLSKTRNSNHLRRLAIDLNFFTKAGTLLSSKNDLQRIGNYWEALDPANRWGGNFTSFLDTPHFERNV